MQKTQVQTSTLGATGLEITRIGFGANPIGGGGWEFGWGSQDDDRDSIFREAEASLERLGVDWRTTAPRVTEPQLSRHLALVGRASQVDPLVEAANLELSDDDVATIEGQNSR